MKCRHWHTVLSLTMADLGVAPPSNAYRTKDQLNQPESFFPLRVLVCESCWLVQTEDYVSASDLFVPDYAYFSSASGSWLRHARNYCEHVVERLSLDTDSLVVEIGCNDGYLLQNLLAAGIPCLGIEPTAATADAAEAAGIPVLRKFFGSELGETLAAEGRCADLIIGNNVYAHVPDINDFTQGLKRALKPDGTITLEFPHLYQLIEHCLFDTIYHEHYSYLSLHVVCQIFDLAELMVYDVEALPTHGGSLRVFGCHKGARQAAASVETLLCQERRGGLLSAESYLGFQKRAEKIKDDLLHFLIERKRAGKTVVGYGAAAKGATLLNYAGIKPDLLPFISDVAPSKQGKYMPGSRIPIVSESVLHENRPDYVWVIPWNIREEIAAQLAYIREWGGQFATAIPKLAVT